MMSTGERHSFNDKCYFIIVFWAIFAFSVCLFSRELNDALRHMLYILLP